MIEHIGNSNRNGGDSRNIKRILFAVLIIVAFVLLSLFLLRSCNSEDAEPTPSEKAPGGVTIGTIDNDVTNTGNKDIQTTLNEQVAEGMFRVFVSTHMDVDEEGNFKPLIQNVGRNRYYCWVEIIDKHGNAVYETDIIPPGYKVEEDTMEPLVSKGNNECEAVFHIMSGNTKESDEVNSVSVAVDIVQA